METARAEYGHAGLWYATGLLVGLFMLVVPGTVAAKSLYLVANHHTGQFDAYAIEPPGTDPPVTYQARYNLSYAHDPADVAVWIEPGTNPPEGALFITSEFDAGFEVVDAKTMTSLGSVPGPSDLGGIDVDDARNIIYTVRRGSDDLYVYDWDPVTRSVTLQPGYPIDLPNCARAIDIALDEHAGLLYVADAGSSLVRIYDVTTWAEVGTIAPSIPPVGMALDRQRGFLYTTHPDSTCASLPQTGNYRLLSKYDLAAGTETTVDMGYGGMGIAVDELTGWVYVTCGCSGDEMRIYDSSLNFVYSTGWIGNPAGIAIGNIGYNPLNLAKNDKVVGQGVYIGQTFTYEITYDNHDNAFDVTGVTIVDTLPPELDFVSETKDGVAGTATYDSGAHTVTWNIGTIPAGAAGPLIDLVVRVNNSAVPGTTICNYCTIDSDQTGPSLVEGTDPDDTSGNPGTYINPAKPLKSFCITKAEIGWAANIFSMSGNFELPSGYGKGNLSASATLSIQIADALGKDTVSFCNLGQAWAYTDPACFANASGEGLNTTKFDISWSSATNALHIEGHLQLDTVGCDTLPAEAKVTLELPLACGQTGGCLVGECMVAFTVEGDVWYSGPRCSNTLGKAGTTSGRFFTRLSEPTTGSRLFDNTAAETETEDPDGDTQWGGSSASAGANGSSIPWFDRLLSFGRSSETQGAWTGSSSFRQGVTEPDGFWFNWMMDRETLEQVEPPERNAPSHDQGAVFDDSWFDLLFSPQPQR